jgi:hypothetical protein
MVTAGLLDVVAGSAKTALGHAEVLFGSVLWRKMEIVEVLAANKMIPCTDLLGENSRKQI